METFAFTVTRADSAFRVKLLTSTVNSAKDSAGTSFYWCVISERGLMANTFLDSALSSELIDEVIYLDDNVGQHVAWNMAYERAKELGAKYFLRLDDDVEFKTNKWLTKLLHIETSLDDKIILSPKVKGLIYPPETTQPVSIGDFELEFLLSAIGGICRLHPMKLIKDYISDVRKPLGSGDATGIAEWCAQHDISKAYARHVVVRHAKGTIGQEESDPRYFVDHAMFQSMPYIPGWVKSC